MTSAQAVRAFDAMYSGFTAVSAVSSDTAWVVSGYGTTDVTGEDETVAVRSAISADTTGAAQTTLDGRRWAGSADLGALLETRSDSEAGTSALLGAVWMVMPSDGWISDARMVDGDRVSVSIETTKGVWASLTVSWDSGVGDWQVAGAPEEPPPPALILPAHFPPRRGDVITALKRFAVWDSDFKKVTLVSGPRIARDSRGRWWAAGVVSAGGQDDLLVYIVGDHGRWRLWDLGTGIDRGELPKDVRSRLKDW